MTASSHVGSTLWVSAVLPNDNTITAYNLLTWTQIKGVRLIGSLGQVDTVIDANVMNKPGKRLRVGTESRSIPLELIEIDDAGQTILVSAINAPMNYAYRISKSNRPTKYFQAFASSVQDGELDPSSIATKAIQLELDSQILEG